MSPAVQKIKGIPNYLPGRRDSFYALIFGAKMDKAEQKKLTEEVERAAYGSMSDPKYWMRRRSKWDEWGSPVGLTLGWAIFVISSAFTLYLLHLSGLF